MSNQVVRDDTSKFSVSTIVVNGRVKNKFETAVALNGQTKWRVVELYETHEDAKIGHYKWFDMVKDSSFHLGDYEEFLLDYPDDK